MIKQTDSMRKDLSAIDCKASLNNKSVETQLDILKNTMIELTTHFNTWLSRALSFASLSSLPIKSRSFRIGAATHAATFGYTDLQIQKMGRCKSSASRRSTRFVQSREALALP